MNVTDTTFGAITRATEEFLIKRGVEKPEVILEKTEFAGQGDVSTNAALKYAKQLGQNPIKVAEDIAHHLVAATISHVADAVPAKPGYVNISFTEDFFTSAIADVLRAAKEGIFGNNDIERGRVWAVEHTSPNPNKAMHLGHLRNNLVGMSFVHLLQKSGATVHTDAIMNDRGIAIAKMMYGFLAHMRKNPEQTKPLVEEWNVSPEQWSTPADRGELPDAFVTECYVAGEKDFVADRSVEQYTRELVLRWEAGDALVRKLSKHLLAYSYEGIQRTLTRLGNRWDFKWYESDHYEEGKAWVKQGLEKGVFKKLEDGAVVTDFSAGGYNIPDTILLKNDGTSLYITQDIALTALKKKKYGADKLVWVIGPEQSLAMKQVFAACEQLGIGALSDFTHMPYGYVGLKDEDGKFKKMSSREGTVVLIDDVIDDVKEHILATLKESGRVRPEHMEETAEKLALAAVKFAILKSERTQDISFDPQQSVDTNGDTGVYVMYTYTRAMSIVELSLKNERPIISTDGEDNVSDPSKQKHGVSQKRHEVSKMIVFYPHVVQRALKDQSIHHVAQFLLKLSAAFNAWYADEVILDSNDEQQKLALVKATAETIKNGLALLGIEPVEQI